MIGALERADIPYMLTGSFASSYHGAPRATQDIDFVVAPTAEQIRALIRLLPESEYYVDEDVALDAQKREGQFNIVDLATGWKLDLIVRKSRPFSHEEFERRSVVEFQGRSLCIATAEDVVIAKLEWAKLGESKRHLEDAAGILRIRAGELDTEYIRRWVKQLRLATEWEAACRNAGLSSDL
ncbi:MAG: hypothetical protein ACRELU_08020 [Gemmatimonadota bacterium]